MATWPITSKEACRRIGIPISTGMTIIRVLKIPTVRIGNSNTLDAASFGQLAKAAEAFKTRQRLKAEPALSS